MKKQDNSFSIKSHEEILELIDEIKEYELLVTDYELIQHEKVGEEIIEINHGESSELNPLPIKEKDNKNFLKRIFKKDINKFKPATFKFRFDKDGSLISPDFIKYKSKPKNEISKKGILGKLKGLRKSKKEEKSKGKKEKKSKRGKLKGGVGKVGKLKRVIPNKGKKSEETE